MAFKRLAKILLWLVGSAYLVVSYQNCMGVQPISSDDTTLLVQRTQNCQSTGSASACVVNKSTSSHTLIDSGNWILNVSLDSFFSRSQGATLSNYYVSTRDMSNLVAKSSVDSGFRFILTDPEFSQVMAFYYINSFIKNLTDRKIASYCAAPASSTGGNITGGTCPQTYTPGCNDRGTNCPTQLTTPVSVITNSSLSGYTENITKNSTGVTNPAIHLMTAGNLNQSLDASIILYHYGIFQIDMATYLDGDKTFKLNSFSDAKDCSNPEGSIVPNGCCTSAKGCVRALQTGAADYMVAMYWSSDPAVASIVKSDPNGYSYCGVYRNPNLNSNLTLTAANNACGSTSANEIHAVGAVYTSIWWNVRQQLGADLVDAVFMLHLKYLHGSLDIPGAIATLSTISSSSASIGPSGLTSAQVTSVQNALTTEYNRRSSN